MKTETQRIVTASLFVVLGLILPYVTAHAYAVPGTVFLPMHMPVLLCGLVTNARYGGLCGLVTPILSHLFTGMPVLFPMLPIMVGQLVVMGTLAGYLYHRTKLSLYPSLALSIAAGWLTYGLAFSAILYFGSGKVGALSMAAAITKGLPGIALQLILVPLVLSAYNRYRRTTPDPRREALRLLGEEGATCVVIRDGSIIHVSKERGVAPLLRLIEDGQNTLEGASVVDKVIGKGAAMLVVLGQAREVYGQVMSIPARDFLVSQGTKAEYGTLVEAIRNRDDTGTCPIEAAVLDIDDLDLGFSKIKQTLGRLVG